MVAQSRQPSLQEAESEELTWAKKKKKNHILTLSQKKSYILKILQYCE